MKTPALSVSLALILTWLLGALSHAQEGSQIFRKTGEYAVGKDKLEITESASRISIVLTRVKDSGGHVSGGPRDYADASAKWFAYVDEEGNLWTYDGSKLSIYLITLDPSSVLAVSEDSFEKYEIEVPAKVKSAKAG